MKQLLVIKKLCQKNRLLTELIIQISLIFVYRRRKKFSKKKYLSEFDNPDLERILPFESTSTPIVVNTIYYETVEEAAKKCNCNLDTIMKMVNDSRLEN